MIEVYKGIYMVAIVLAAILLIAATITFFSFHIVAVVKELKNSSQEEDIKVLLKNSVLLNPQIQDDIENIDGYNDLLASYFRILKEQEKQREELLARAQLAYELEQLPPMPTYEMKLNVSYSFAAIEQYSAEVVGTETIVECYKRASIAQGGE